MFLSRWLRGGLRPTSTSKRPRQLIRPVIQSLEDRIVPVATKPIAPLSVATTGSAAAAGPAMQLRVVVPEAVQSGSSFTVLVEADTASNRVASTYTGTVRLSLGTTAGAAALPADYTFTAADHGLHRFTVTLAAAGSQTITATDTVTTTITGSATTTVLPAPVATSLLVVTPSQAATGVATGVTVKVLDASGHVIPNYTGTITVSSSDTQATGAATRSATPASLPITYTFTAADHGQHTFQVTFLTGDASGTPTTVSAVDSTGAVTGQASLTVYPPTTVTHFALRVGSPATGSVLPAAGHCVGGTASATVGSPVAVTVVALNAANQVVTGYTGTISLASTDQAAVATVIAGGTTSSLSAFSYMFTATDNGSHVFYVTFGTAGQQTLTATDAATTSAVGTANFKVRGS
jgi:hypothetical protein